MHNKQRKHDTYLLVLKDQTGNVAFKQKVNLTDFATLINDKDILNTNNDIELEYYLIKHPEIRIKMNGKLYWHQNYTSGKGMCSTFLFVEE